MEHQDIIIHLGHAIFFGVECYISRVKHSVQLCYGTLNSSYGTLHSSYGTLHSSFWNITSLIWNIALSILKYEKKPQAGYSTFFKDTNFQKWDFYIRDTGSFSMIPSLDETRQTMKEQNVTFIAYIQIDAHLMFLTSFKMNFYTHFPLIPLFKIFSNRPVCILPLMLSGAQCN